MSTNWFGIESHPTDTYIHWKTRDKERLKEAEKLRAAYDKIIALGLQKELAILTEAAYNMGTLDEHESNSQDI